MMQAYAGDDDGLDRARILLQRGEQTSKRLASIQNAFSTTPTVES